MMVPKCGELGLETLARPSGKNRILHLFFMAVVEKLNTFVFL